MEKEQKHVYDYESLSNRIQAIGLLYERMVIPIQEGGSIANDGVFYEITESLSELFLKASNDARELFNISVKNYDVLREIGIVKT